MLHSLCVSCYGVKILKFICLLLSIFLYSCALKPVQVTKNTDFKQYRYAYINSSNTVTSVSSYTDYNSHSHSYSQHVNPSEYIAGFLMKNDILIINQIKQPKKTLIVNYGQSGKRNIAGGLFGYTLEVTIQFIDASSHNLIAKCSAEGFGSSEVEDIRQAIGRCLQSLM